MFIYNYTHIYTHIYIELNSHKHYTYADTHTSAMLTVVFRRTVDAMRRHQHTSAGCVRRTSGRLTCGYALTHSLQIVGNRLVEVKDALLVVNCPHGYMHG